MAMKQMQLTKQAHSAAWVKIFTEDVTTVKGSLVFVKQFTALSFSIISYMRSIFPEIAYTEKELDNVKVKILAGNYDCKDAYLMTKWIKSAFDALNNNYMRELVLEILSPEDTPLEYYAIEYKYTQDGPTCSLSTNSKVLDFDRLKFENKTKKLINNLLTITENLEPLPKKYKLQLRINYYDEVTPSHYKPKFFSHAKGSGLEEKEKLKKKAMGSIETPYHNISVYSGSRLVALDDSETSFYIDPETEPQRTAENDHNKSAEIAESTEMTVDNSKPNNNVEDLKSNTNWTWSMDKSASQEGADITPVDNVDNQGKVHCICSQEYEKDSTFKCQRCESLHHLVCYKISTFGKAPENCCCYSCANLDDTAECTDVTLMKYKPRQAKHLAIYRQVLYRCHGMKNISPKTLQAMSVPDYLQDQIITKLLEESFIKCQNRAKKLYKVNKGKLSHFFKFYFST